MSNDNEESAFRMSDNIPPENDKDRITFHGQTGKIHWRIKTMNNVFDWLNLPFFFKDAPENVKHDLVEWCRACAIADRRHTEHPKLPDTVKEFKDSPEIKLLRSSKANGGQARLDVVG